MLNNCIVSGNTAQDGGGIYNYGENGITSLQVANSVVSGNSASLGAGIYNDGSFGQASATMTISNSTLTANSAVTAGGGIYNDGSLFGYAGLQLSNTTVSGNLAKNSGGGVFNNGDTNGSAALEISNTTLSDNSANAAGTGIYNLGASTMFGSGGLTGLANTIIKAGNMEGSIFNDSGTVMSRGYNLSSDNGGGYLTGPGDQINTHPMLGPLQDNGGPTFTHALLPGSPAIDAGDPNFTPPPLYDQRGPGFDRVVNGRLDIGSFEVQSGGPTPTPTPTPTVSPTATPTPTATPRATPRPRPTPRLRPTPPG
jgi:hypothetical protein